MRIDRAGSRSSELSPLESGAVLLLVVTLITTLGITTLLSVGDTPFWFSLFALALILSAPYVHGALRHRFDIFEPIFIVTFAYAVYYLYVPVSDLLEGRQYTSGVDPIPMFPRGAFVLGVGLVTMYLGYYGPYGRRTAAVLPEPGAVRRGAAGYALLLAAAATFIFGIYVSAAQMSWTRLITLGQLGGTPDTAVLSEMDSPFQAYLFTVIDWYAGAILIALAFMKRQRWWIAVGFVLVMAIYITIGFRYRVLILAVAPMVFWYLRRDRRPGLLALGGLAVAAVLIFGTIGQLRLYFRAGAQVDPELLTTVEAQEAFGRDISLYQPYLTVVSAFPDRHDYLWGRSYTYLLMHPIPRRLWPDKPDAPAREIIRDAYDSEKPVIAGVAFPNVGEFYANFGVVGVGFGMFFFGIVMRAIYEYLRRHPDNDWTRILFAIALPFLVQVVSRGYTVQIVQEAVSFFGPVLGGMWLLRRRAEAAAARAASSPPVMAWQPRTPLP